MEEALFATLEFLSPGKTETWYENALSAVLLCFAIFAVLNSNCRIVGYSHKAVFMGYSI